LPALMKIVKWGAVSVPHLSAPWVTWGCKHYLNGNPRLRSGFKKVKQKMIVMNHLIEVVSLHHPAIFAPKKSRFRHIHFRLLLRAHRSSMG
jgi:hypothetical protein